MKNMPDLTKAKMMRVDKKHNCLLVWFGGEYIKVFPLRSQQTYRSVTVLPPPDENWITFSTVKRKMREIVNEESQPPCV